VAWHRFHVTNGPTEAANNLRKPVTRAALGMRSFRNYRIRSTLYAGEVNWLRWAPQRYVLRPRQAAALSGPG
jgi:hypothetical protein